MPHLPLWILLSPPHFANGRGKEEGKMERPCKRRRRRRKRKGKGMDTSSSWEKEDKRGGREAFSFLREGGKAVLWSGGKIRNPPPQTMIPPSPFSFCLLRVKPGVNDRERERERERERCHDVPHKEKRKEKPQEKVDFSKETQSFLTRAVLSAFPHTFSYMIQWSVSSKSCAHCHTTCFWYMVLVGRVKKGRPKHDPTWQFFLKK